MAETILTKKRAVAFGRPIIGEPERKAVLDVLAGDILVHGPRAVEFEQKFAEKCGAKFGVSVSSCTAGMHLYYFHLGLGAGDEVIVPAQTHTATAHAVELTGAKPVFVDAERNTGNIDIDAIEAAISPRTRAISVVHYLGMPVEMKRVNAIAAKHNLRVLEDCALAIGTREGGRHAGNFGHCGVFSFYPVKHMTTAEGGIILTNDADLAHALTRKKAFGVDRTVSERKVPGVYDVTMLGFNYRMNEIQAAIGIEQIKRIDSFLESRARNYARLAQGLREIGEVELLQSTHGDLVSSYYCLSVILSPKLAEKRFEIVKAVNDLGVGTSVYYPKPVPHMRYYADKHGYRLDSFPNAARISYQSIALSVGPHLNEEDMDYTVAALKEAIRTQR